MSDERIANLKRWAELAPGECRLAGDSIYMKPFEGWYFYRVAPFADNPHFRALLLSALIEAIRARGDSMGSAWYLNMYVDSSGMSAEIKRGLLPVGEEHEAPEPCDALLSAYVHALSALTEGRER